MHGIHAATSRVENLVQGLSCLLKFVYCSASDEVHCIKSKFLGISQVSWNKSSLLMKIDLQSTQALQLN